MFSLLRYVYNRLYRSSHRFEDGSALYYIPPYNIIRYYTGEAARRIADIPLIYNESNGMLRIDSNVTWKWRDPGVSKQEWSDSGPSLSESERFELSRKLRLLLAKQPKRFELFV